MCVRARLVTGVWPVLREKLHRCEHTTVLRQPFNGFIIRQYYNNKFVASVDFDFEWLASKIILRRYTFLVPSFRICCGWSRKKRVRHFQSWKQGKDSMIFAFLVYTATYLFHSRFRFRKCHRSDRIYFHRPDGTIRAVILSIN